MRDSREEIESDNEVGAAHHSASAASPLFQSTLPFVILLLVLVNLRSMLAFPILALIIVVSALRIPTDDWHKQKWPWVVVVMLALQTIANLILFGAETLVAK